MRANKEFPERKVAGTAIAPKSGCKGKLLAIGSQTMSVLLGQISAQ